MAFEVWRLAVIGNLLGQEMVNVFHYAKPDGIADGDGMDLINTWLTNVAPAYLDACPLAYTLLQLTARKLGTTTEATLDTIRPGVRIGTVNAPQVAPTVTWETPFATRSARGRSFIPGVVDADCLNGLLSNGLQLALDAFTAAIIPDLVGTIATYLLCVHSRKFNTTRRVTSGIVHEIARTQRRRELGVGA